MHTCPLFRGYTPTEVQTIEHICLGKLEIDTQQNIMDAHIIKTDINFDDMLQRTIKFQ